jgi:hypothetical protein
MIIYFKYPEANFTKKPQYILKYRFWDKKIGQETAENVNYKRVQLHQK